MIRRLALAFPVALVACTGLGGLASGDDAGVPDGGTESGTEAPPVPPMPPPTDGGADADPSATYRSAVMADTPISYWRFEETSGTVAKDEMGTHDGTYVFAPVLGGLGVAGSRGMGIGVGTSAHVDLTTTDFHFTGVVPFTVEVWALPKTIGDYQWLGTTETNTGSRTGWSAFLDPTGVLSFEIWSTTDGGPLTQARGLYASAHPITSGVFHHVVVTYNGLALAIWIDGQRITIVNAPNPAPDFGALVRWGCRNTQSGALQCLEGGSLDEIAIYDHVLPDPRIELHHQLGL